MPAPTRTRIAGALAATLVALGAPLGARADAIVDWNDRTSGFIAEAKLGTPPAIRLMAVTQTAAYEAVDALGRGRPLPPHAVDAAVAAAHRAALEKLLPAQQQAVDAAYRAALAPLPDDAAKAAGIAAGERAAATTLARRADDLPPPESHRPHTTPGAYVPTSAPAAVQWPQRKPWLMTGAAQFRPGPPPALTSETWARDLNEVKALGARSSTRRTAEQTEIARFWEYSLPAIYFGVARAVAQAPGRGAAQNARLYAAVAQAMDDAMIAVFDAKYHYGFWRPVTAIRNGDTDGNDATERDAAWTSLIEAPLHPEYPSAHSILAAAVGAVLSVEVGQGPMPVLSTASPTAKGAVRRWTSVDDFVAEVANARIYEGIHYRTSTEVGAAMGRRIGDAAVRGFLLSPQ
jgi:membrane-associated phospholipid phosphatase